jgi:hypothetical protein
MKLVSTVKSHGLRALAIRSASSRSTDQNVVP